MSSIMLWDITSRYLRGRIICSQIWESRETIGLIVIRLKVI